MDVQFRQSVRPCGKVILAALTVACMALDVAPAFAQISTDRLIEGAKQCTRQLPRYEREYAIPTHLLSAISSTESGRYHTGLKIKLPWPWTVNANGEGYYLDSKAEAIALVKKLQKKGIRSIDVGCMQVNLVHHPRAFANLDEAFDPEHNVAYAASFLRSIYQEERSWKKAAAYYHSRVPARGSTYVGHVYRSWYTIVDKLRMAEVQVPTSAVMAMNDMKKTTATDLKKTTASRKASAVQPIKVARLPEQKGKKVAAYNSPRMNSIEVKTVEHARQDRGVIVVTPDIKVMDSGGMQTASNIPVGKTYGGALRVIQVAQATTTAPANPQPVKTTTTTQRSGPTFIFND